MTAGERGFLLLGSHLGCPDRHPLSAPQLRRLAQRMREAKCPEDAARELTARDLMSLGYDGEAAQRIVHLLSGEDVLAHYLSRAAKCGCVPLTRVSKGYPDRLRQRLGLDAPACLWARGDVSLLSRPAAALVGSRELREENRRFAAAVGAQAARQGVVLVSGNARGADRTAQDASLASGGSVISVVADSLADKLPRAGMLYLSEDGMDEEFSAMRAISRNRVIHALGDRTFVAQCSLRTGGTWDGTVKNLRFGWSPVFVFSDGSEAARLLSDMGAQTVGMSGLSDFSALHRAQTDLFS